MKDIKNDHRRSKEIAGVILFAVSLYLILCLVSYKPADPSFTHYVPGKVVIKNLGGFVGAYCSDSLLRVLGISAYWIPLVFIMLSFQLLLNRKFRITPLSVAGFIGLVFSTAALLAGRYKTISLFGVNLNAGGLLGTLSSNFLQSYLNHIGTYILLVVLFIVSLMITLDVSMVSLTRQFLLLMGNAIVAVKTFLLIRIERLKRKKKTPHEKKARAKRDVPVIRDEPTSQQTKARRKKIEQIPFEFVQSADAYTLPPLTILDDVAHKDTTIKRESLIMNSRLLEKKLSDFGVEAKVVEVKPGPVIAMYELEPAPGVKINRITNLSDDLAMALKAQSVRIIAPIPGKSVIGIEIPNYERDVVHLKDVVDNEGFLNGKFKLPIALGVDIIGTPVITDLVRMPHLLIAGTTGSGKSVSLNAMICSILFKSKPDDVKFLMIDPKRLELSAYEGIPHLLHPVVVNPKKASQVLKWAVEEMERRYKIISTAGVKSIEKYNRLLEKGLLAADGTVSPPEATRTSEAETSPTDTSQHPGDLSVEADNLPEKLPYIVIVIDELADLMMVAQRNVEESLARLAQMARAAGIHLILATQRPSVDVITGIIKANFPTRISFQVSSKVDSRTILDTLGAEKLLGAGDMLFVPPGTSKMMRIHGPYVSDREIKTIVEFVRKQASPLYDESISEYKPEARDEIVSEELDEKYDAAVELVTDLGQASISLVQRYLKIGYNRAARIIDRMEAEGVVGPSDGVKPRKVLAGKLPK
jgi:S-DNA-T family DNA segregation ATPase FtsK/SpoIIIE